MTSEAESRKAVISSLTLQPTTARSPEPGLRSRGALRHREWLQAEGEDVKIVTANNTFGIGSP